MNPERLLDEQLSFFRANAAAYESWHAEVFERGGGGSFGEGCRKDRARALGDLGWRARLEEGEHSLWGRAVRGDPARDEMRG